MTGIIVLVVYCTLFIGSLLVVTWATRNFFSREDYTSLKTCLLYTSPSPRDRG